MQKRAEKAAMKAYPIEHNKSRCITGFGVIEIDMNSPFRKGFQQGYEQAEKDLGWVSVKERLPDERIDVVIHDRQFNQFHVGYMKGRKWWYPGEFDEQPVIVDYWMPISEIPKKKKQWATK